MNKTTVFGGWAVSPEILKRVFGEGVDYVDVNKIMPKLFDSSRRLRGDWVDAVINEYQLTAENAADIAIAGWSTGTIFAYATARVCCPRELILLSATPCFCRRDGFRFGMRSSAIDQMINALAVDRDAVLRSFYERCGLEYDPAAIPNYTVEELSCGLEFLKQADLRPLTPLPIKPIFRHGTDDLIIPVSASKYFCEQTAGEFVEAAGGHAFFCSETCE